MTTNDASVLANKLSVFPRLGLASLPTPLEPMRRLSAHLGGPRLWVKREDATGLGFGGNKLRKLDYVLHEAVAAKADVLVSGGVVQSNSQRQVAAAAAKLGMECHLAVYHGRLAAPTPEYETSGNALLNRLYGAHLHDVPWTGDRNAAIEELGQPAQARWSSGRTSCRTVFPIRSARSPTHRPSWRSRSSRRRRAFGRPRSCIAPAVRERRLVLWSARRLRCPRRASSALTSMPNQSACAADVIAYASAAAELIGTRFDETDVEVVAGHAGPAYGVPHAATIEAIKLAGSLEALALDPVYSGKGLAGLIALVRARRWPSDTDVIFIHTGGAPALFAYQSVLGI